MSESQSSQVFMFDNSDPEMQRAYEAARLTFRYFWREVGAAADHPGPGPGLRQGTLLRRAE